MTLITSDFSDDRDRLRELRRTKLAATLVLALCLLALLALRPLESRYPVLGFVAAFAEAGLIGGLADWYAVVALFKRPLGLPIPHTAIIARNQARIGDSLGAFIVRHFLAEAPVAAKVQEVDFARLIADWLRDRDRSDDLAHFILKMLPQAMESVEGSGLRPFLARRATDQLRSIELAPLAAGLLTTFTHDRRHQRLLDELLVAMNQLLGNPEALDAVRDKIRDELPSLFNLFRADAYVLRKLVNSVSSFLDEVRADEGHAVRREFDRFVASFITRLRDEPDYAERLDKLKVELLARPEISNLADGLWESLKSFVTQETSSPDSALRAPLRGLLMEIGRDLEGDAALRADINRGMAAVIETFVATHKGAIAQFVADQVKAWDVNQLTRMVELNVGKDLQYIRFNGTLIGGGAGLVLHALKVAVQGG
ncbi:MAG TPA: DUF445 domain-containing protein [Vineibacter sp.]|nr:DUF445 domain-containing protein [Vineibacter sp.]